MAKELKIKITGDATGLQKAADDGVNILGGFSQRVSAMSIAAGNLLADGLKSGLVAVKGFLGGSIGAAADMNETVSKIGVVFGSSAGDIEKFAADAATALGQSKQQAMDAAATFAVFGKSAGLSEKDLVGFSTTLVQTATDLASINNTSAQDAIDAISQGLRGEQEGLRRYGILLDDATLRQKALEMGIVSSTKNALTPQQKVLAAQQVIMGQAAYAMNDFKNTSGGLAGQTKILKAQFENFKTVMGQAFLPIALKVTTLLSTKLLPVLEKWGPLMANEIAGGIKAFVAAFNAMDGDVTSSGFAGVMERIGYAARIVVERVREMLPALKEIGGAILGATQSALAWLRDNFDEIRNVVSLMGPPLVATVAAFMAFQKIGAAVVALKAFALAAKAASLALLANPVGLVIAGLGALVGVLYVAYRRSETFREAVNALARRLLGFVQAVKAAFDRGGIGEAFRVALDGIKGALSDLGGWLMSTALPWLSEQASALAKKLGGWVGAAAGFLREHLPVWLAALGEWITGTALPWLGEQASALAQKLGGWIVDAAQYLRDNLPGWLGTLAEWIVGTAIPWLIIQGHEMAFKLGGWVIDAGIELLKNLPGWLATFTGWWYGTAVPGVIDFAKDAAKALGKAFLEALDFMDDIAREVVEGIISGLGKMAGRLAGAVQNFISENITSKIKDALSINSPSRVTMELGVGVAEGLMLGMQRSVGMVSSAATGLAFAAVPQPGGAGGFAAPSSAGWDAAPIVVHTYLDGRQIATSLAPHQRQLERSKR